MIGLVLTLAALVAVTLLSYFGVSSSERTSPRVRITLILACVGGIVGSVFQYVGGTHTASQLDKIQSVTAGGNLDRIVVLPQVGSAGMSLRVINPGDAPLLGVSVLVIDHKSPAMGRDVNIGTIAPKFFRSVSPGFTPDLGSDDVARYNFVISSNEGIIAEYLQLRKAPQEKWEYAVDVFKNDGEKSVTLQHRDWSVM